MFYGLNGGDFLAKQAHYSPRPLFPSRPVRKAGVAPDSHRIAFRLLLVRRNEHSRVTFLVFGRILTRSLCAGERQVTVYAARPADCCDQLTTPIPMVPLDITSRVTGSAVFAYSEHETSPV